MNLADFVARVITVWGEDHDLVVLAARCHRLIEFTDSCWLWRGATNQGDYGAYNTARQFALGGLAHRVSYQLLIGEIPEGADLDHTCCVRQCVNPAHLEPVTRSENLSRASRRRHGGEHPSACANGHPWTPENRMRSSKRHGWTRCRLCHNERERARKEQSMNTRIGVG